MASVNEIDDETVLKYALMQLSIVLKKTKSIRRLNCVIDDIGNTEREIEAFIKQSSKFDQVIIGKRLNTLSKEINKLYEDQECYCSILDLYFKKK